MLHCAYYLHLSETLASDIHGKKDPPDPTEVDNR